MWIQQKARGMSFPDILYLRSPLFTLFDKSPFIKPLNLHRII